MLKSILWSLKVKKTMQYLEVVYSEALSSTLAHPTLLNNLLKKLPCDFIYLPLPLYNLLFGFLSPSGWTV